MAAGCVPVLPSAGGAAEYAVNGSNSFLTRAGFTALAATSMLVEHRGRLCAMRARGLADSRRFSMRAASSALFELLHARHTNHSRTYVDYSDMEPRLVPVPLEQLGWIGNESTSQLIDE